MYRLRIRFGPAVGIFVYLVLALLWLSALGRIWPIHAVESENLLHWSIASGLALAAILKWRFNEIRLFVLGSGWSLYFNGLVEMLLLTACCSLFYANTVVTANVIGDRKVPTDRTLPVVKVETYPLGKGEVGWSVCINDWKYPGSTIWLQGDNLLFIRRPNERSKLIVTEHAGWLGYEWISRFRY